MSPVWITTYIPSFSAIAKDPDPLCYSQSLEVGCSDMFQHMLGLIGLLEVSRRVANELQLPTSYDKNTIA